MTSRQSTDLDEILRVVQRLEKENRRFKRGALVILLLITALLVLGVAPPPRVLETEKLLLKDADGRVRGRLELDALGRPSLTFVDVKGLPEVSLLGGTDPSLILKQAGKDNQIQLGTFTTDLYGLALYGEDKGQAHGILAGLGVFQGVPGLTLYSENGLEQAGLVANKLGPMLSLSDTSGEPKTVLTVSSDSPSFMISDKEGFRTVIGVNDLESPRTGVKYKTSAASIRLSGSDGSTLWTAP